MPIGKDEVIPDREKPSNGQNSFRWWTSIFFANLVVPGLLGVGTVSSLSALMGMILAVVVLYALGLYLWRTVIWWKMFMRIGGLVIAATQIVPLIHFIAGILAIGFVHSIGLEGGPVGGLEKMPGVDGIISGFLVTMITAAFLVVAAQVIGGALYCLYKLLQMVR